MYGSPITVAVPGSEMLPQFIMCVGVVLQEILEDSKARAASRKNAKAHQSSDVVELSSSNEVCAPYHPLPCTTYTQYTYKHIVYGHVLLQSWHGWDGMIGSSVNS